jgi:hypothetical protein
MPKTGLFLQEILPFYVSLALLIAATLVADGLLHLLGIAWVGRYLGIPGVLLILLSFGHSLRKRGFFPKADPVRLLRLHERLAWTGSLLVLVHAGIHFNGWLAWLAVVAMIVNVTSGLTGRYLLQRAQRWLKAARTDLTDKGLSPGDIEQQLFWDSLAFGVVRQWRQVHVPITMTFGVLALAHVIAILLFWDWRP